MCMYRWICAEKFAELWGKTFGRGDPGLNADGAKEKIGVNSFFYFMEKISRFYIWIFGDVHTWKSLLRKLLVINGADAQTSDIRSRSYDSAFAFRFGILLMGLDHNLIQRPNEIQFSILTSKIYYTNVLWNRIFIPKKIT